MVLRQYIKVPTNSEKSINATANNFYARTAVEVPCRTPGEGAGGGGGGADRPQQSQLQGMREHTLLDMPLTLARMGTELDTAPLFQGHREKRRQIEIKCLHPVSQAPGDRYLWYLRGELLSLCSQLPLLPLAIPQRGGRSSAGMHWKGGRYPPPPPGRPAYAQPLSP